MHSLRTVLVVVASVLMVGGMLVFPSRILAHCDSTDGPVVTAAREALEANTVELVLIWVLPQDEQEIRSAFERTKRVRASGGEARELADLWFFETLVRVHRAGEGEPYTGLKPAGTEIPEGIVQADRALEEGSVDALATHLAGRAASLLRERFAGVQDLSDYDAMDVPSGRRYVQAYVAYMHFVEQLHGLLTGDAETHWSEHGDDEQ